MSGRFAKIVQIIPRRKNIFLRTVFFFSRMFNKAVLEARLKGNNTATKKNYSPTYPFTNLEPIIFFLSSFCRLLSQRF